MKKSLMILLASLGVISGSAMAGGVTYCGDRFDPAGTFNECKIKAEGSCSVPVVCLPYADVIVCKCFG